VVVLAQEEARLLNHNYIGTEHILLGLIREGEGVAAQVLVKLGADLSRVQAKVIELLSGSPVPETGPRTVFVVHGHADDRTGEVARLIESLTGQPPVVLREQPDDGRAILAAFENHTHPAVAVVILSGDDEGRTRATDDKQLHLRARQNVVYEMGWFHGRLGPRSVIALIEHGVDAPTDISGIASIPFDIDGVWRDQLGRELRAAGLDIDLDDTA
jgi:predicted nucleotide-binding protein